MTAQIVFLPGDGVGPEVASSARLVLTRIAKTFDIALEITEYDFGGAAIDACGEPFPASTREACLRADAIFLGAVGGPKWDGGAIRPEAGLLEMRKRLGVYANLRPIRVMPGMEDISPLRREAVENVDIMIVRELTGGIYFGTREEVDERATDECCYTREEVVRVARIAFESARGRKGRVTSVDKANVLATSRLWRNAVNDLHKEDYSDITLNHQLVDSMAMKLITQPGEFDVVLTENMFGDILSDEASVIAGSIGLSPSASLGEGARGVYEPIHGSAPDIAGRDIANPIGAILSIAMLLRHSLGADAAALAVERAVEDANAQGARTIDTGGKLSGSVVAERIADRL